MTRRQECRRVLALAGAAAALLAACWWLLTLTAHANGESVTVFEGSDGPYTVTVGVLPEEPKVGSVHITVAPVYTDSSEPVEGAQVEILATESEGEEAYHTFAVSVPEEPQYYDGNLLIEHTGTWTLKVTVSKEGEGVGEFELTLEVTEDIPNAGRLGTALWAGIVAVVFGGGVYMTIAIRRSQRRRGATE